MMNWHSPRGRESAAVAVPSCQCGHFVKTRCSAAAEGPRDALCESKSCQLLHSCTKNHISKTCSREWPWGWIKVIGISLFDRPHITSY